MLHVYQTYFPDAPGGLQEAIRQIAIATKSYGVETSIFTLTARPVPQIIQRFEGNVIRSKLIASWASCNLGGIDSISEFWSLSKKFDLINYHFPWPFADFLHMLIRPKIPAVMTYHSDIVRQRWLNYAYAPLMRHMLSRMSAVVATSPDYVRTSPVLKQLNLDGRLSIIPLGLNDVLLSHKEDVGIFGRINLNPRTPYFLFVGVLRYYKGLHTLIEAAASVGAAVVIAGSGPKAASLQLQASNLGLSNIYFAGQVTESEKFALIKHCRAMVLPSHMRSEAYGMVLVEASMFAKPMITCEIGTGTSYINQHDVSGYVVPPESPLALAHAMRILLADKDLGHRFGLAARQRYEKLFSSSFMGNLYAHTYQAALSRQLR